MRSVFTGKTIADSHRAGLSAPRASITEQNRSEDKRRKCGRFGNAGQGEVSVAISDRRNCRAAAEGFQLEYRSKSIFGSGWKQPCEVDVKSAVGRVSKCRRGAVPDGVAERTGRNSVDADLPDCPSVARGKCIRVLRVHSEQNVSRRGKPHEIVAETQK